jgi:hypothetical protein
MSAESKLVSAIADACVDFLIERGELNGKLRVTRELHTAARRVVWAAEYYGPDSVIFGDALVDLERLVGRPTREIDI